MGKILQFKTKVQKASGIDPEEHLSRNGEESLGLRDLFTDEELEEIRRELEGMEEQDGLGNAGGDDAGRELEPEASGTEADHVYGRARIRKELLGEGGSKQEP
jgi:hypothetical protein